MADRFLEAGKITSVHGIRGEVKIASWCDSPEFLCEFDYFYMDTQGKNVMNVEHSRVFKNMVIAKFEGCDTAEEAAKLREKILYISRDDVELDDNTYFIKDLIGMRVVDKDTGTEYGKITEVFQTGANDVYSVKGQDKQYLIPAIADVVYSTDIEGRIMLITPLEGLMEDEN